MRTSEAHHNFKVIPKWLLDFEPLLLPQKIETWAKTKLDTCLVPVAVLVVVVADIVVASAFAVAYPYLFVVVVDSTTAVVVAVAESFAEWHTAEMLDVPAAQPRIVNLILKSRFLSFIITQILIF